MSHNQNKGPARRRFFKTMGTAVGGLGVMLAGGALHAEKAQAKGVSPANVGLLCCSGTACPGYYCPTGTTYAGYCWSCVNAGATYVCQDCLKNGSYYCTFPEFQGPCC